MRQSEYSQIHRNKVEWWLPWAGKRGKWEVVSGQFQLYKMKDSGGLWHSTVSRLNASEPVPMHKNGGEKEKDIR